MHRSTISLPLYGSYDSQEEGIDMEENESFLEIDHTLDLCDTNPEEDGEDIGSASWLDRSGSHPHTTSPFYLKDSGRATLSNYDTQSSYASSPIKSASDAATNVGDCPQECSLDLGFKLPKRQQRNEPLNIPSPPYPQGAIMSVIVDHSPIPSPQFQRKPLPASPPAHQRVRSLSFSILE
ncbi:15515_t:CDS:2, partial [Acaulospora colombiana]